jgi:predicted GTPase
VTLEHTEICEASESRLFFLKLLFEEMQRFYYFLSNESLKPAVEQIINNFRNIMNSEVKIAVIATMSSGKSTLINAMIGEELLPSRNSACTATITHLKNNDLMAGKDWLAGWYDINRKLIGYSSVTPELMERLNNDECISDICIEGDFPNIKSKYFPLIITDTPGPNNSRTESHKEHTYRIIRNNNAIKPVVLYVLNATQLEIHDDDELLTMVAKELYDPGEQSKDRFIFVVNKMDILDEERGEKTRDTLNSVKQYLKKHGIENPNIYPVAAEMCKVLRMFENGKKLTKNQQRVKINCDLFNDFEDKHLEKFAPLTPSNQRKMQELLKAADGDCYKEAEIHTGIPALELAINEYLEKHKLPIKIKEAVDALKAIENIKKLISEDEEKWITDFIKKLNNIIEI